MKKLNIVPVKRRCAVRGCAEGPNTGKRVFAAARGREMGAGMIILCEDCIGELYTAAFGEENVKKPRGRKARTDAIDPINKQEREM